MSKKTIIGALIALCALSLMMCCGCGASGAQSQGDTREITDVYGRSVEIPASVESVATVGSAARYVVYAGGQEGVDKLVAVTEKETEASTQRPYTVAYSEVFASLPSTSNGNHLMETSVDAEALLALGPDVIISSRSAAECDDLQQALGIPVVGISYQDQMFADDVYNSITVVGEVLGTQKNAEKVVDALKEWQQDLADRTADLGIAAEITTYAGGINYKGAKGITGTYCGFAPFKALGANNVADQLNLTPGAVDVTLEQLGAWDPQVMFLMGDNATLLQKEYADNQAFFQQLTSVQEDKVYSIASFNMNGTNLELALCDTYFMGATLYPEAFASVDLQKQFDEICQTLLGVSYSNLGLNQSFFGIFSFAA